MSNKIFDILNKPVANPSKNGFDLSQPFPYSLKLGQVKPIYYQHTVADGHYRISIDELCHTEPFITDPFVRLSKHFEVVFVPYSQLWRGFNHFIGHSDDIQSSYENGHNFVPVFSLGAMLARIWNSTKKDMQGLRIVESALSLLDMLGYGAHPLYKMADPERTIYIQSLNNKYVNAWSLLAYNKIWNTYYRDSQHTSSLNPSIFNADKVPCTSEVTSIMDSYYTDDELLELVTIKYRKSKRDLFTSSLNSRQFGAVELVPVNMSELQTYIRGNGEAIGYVPSHNTESTSQLNSSSPIDSSQGIQFFNPNQTPSTSGWMAASRSGGGSPASLTHSHSISETQVISLNSTSIPGLSAQTVGNGSFDVYSLLTAQLMQKWRETIQRAGQHTDDRLRAVYGRSPRFDADVMPYIIGSHSYNITANQVTATGASEGVKVGDIAAKGMGYSQRNEFEFTSSEFGVIMVLTYILPENSYLAPIDKLNTLVEPFDYFTPQLDSLGLEQVEKEFYKLLEYDSTRNEYTIRSSASDFARWAARYWYYKCKVPVVHLGFEHGQENSKWYPSRIDIDPSGTVVNPFYVSPNEYDTVFGTTTDYHIDTDQFVCFASVKSHDVLPMSELGIPRW